MLFNNIEHIVRNLIRGISNIWRWKKTIWHDRDYDYHYIYEVLKTKLNFQKEYIEKYQIHEGWESYAKQIEECIQLIEDLQNDKCFEHFTSENITNETVKSAEICHEETRKKLFSKIEANIEYWWD